jgi:hypothetical protein
MVLPLPWMAMPFGSVGTGRSLPTLEEGKRTQQLADPVGARPQQQDQQHRGNGIQEVGQGSQ